MHWIISSTALGLLACSAIGKPMETGEWEGTLNFGPNLSNFRPCNSRESWWLKGERYTDIEDQLRKMHAEITESPYDKVYARLQGKRSKNKGQYGGLGTYDRVFYVSKILEVRPSQPDDCQRKK
ncbi:MAG: hypothetical protein JW981_10995 [Anaerolineae bacterium]|nr:hypothetical protein [Anaerolineae bacterium]